MGDLPSGSQKRGSVMKWKILTVCGLAFGVMGIGWGLAQERKSAGFFELRVHTALPGKRNALASRFASRTAAIYARYGITGSVANRKDGIRFSVR
jgi:hypothetical protein